MAFTDLIKPGDKIDIRLLQQVENEERTGDTVKVYKSQVLDINKRGNLEIYDAVGISLKHHLVRHSRAFGQLIFLSSVASTQQNVEQ